MKPIIETSLLSVGYRNGTQTREIISELNVSVNRGELIGIIGQNGIGKSTLLRTLTQLQPPLKGNVLIDGKDIAHFPKNEFARKVSFVSTEIIRLNHCTVRELVAFGRYPYTNWFGKLTQEDELAVSEAIGMVGMNNLAHRHINEISDGERQRAMIARSLAQDTDIIVLDEPTAFLDMPNKFEVVHLLCELTRKKQKTILFSSHDLNIAMKEADRLWLIMPDTFLDGAPEDLVLQHSISKIFEQTRLKFDSRKGEFSIRRKPVGYCQLTGKGTPLIWTKKALERIGFDTESETGDYAFDIDVIEISHSLFWDLKLPNGSGLRFASIYELTTFLKPTITSK
ncbi:MAG: ABC transporter ATP-binding protein [Bacteroidota bacterium]|nr:ABC transporter ATP-binding protein [Bacteroidota bacterium]